MNTDWEKVEIGPCRVVVITAKRFEEMAAGQDIQPKADFLLSFVPEDAAAEPLMMWVETRERVRELIQCIAPNAPIHTRTGGHAVGEDADALMAYCSGNMH